jgi:Coenzyme PQQ synthesis protein D (PqqD)
VRIRHHELSWKTVDDEVVALDLATGTYFSANPSGSRLWERLSEGCDRADLILALVTEYEISEKQAERDVDGFLDELRRNALLESTALRAGA